MPGRRSPARSLLELLVVAAAAVALALAVQALLVKPYRIPSESMVPTLEVGERVLVNRLGNRLGDPGVGDVVVFSAPAQPDHCARDPEPGAPCDRAGRRPGRQAFIKRIVGGPGDRLRIDRGLVIRNGRLERNPAARRCEGPTCDFPRTIVVPAGHFYVMGDNRGASSDSRVWGPVPREWIVGKAFATYWPPAQLGPL